MASNKRFGAAQLFRAAHNPTARRLPLPAIITSQYRLLPLRCPAWLSPGFWRRMVYRVAEISAECVGQPLTGAQVAYVANHLSYPAIPVVGSVALGRFVAKANMQPWPIIALLARLQHTVFISRSPRDAIRAIGSMDGALNRPDSLMLVAEGISSACARPFDSSAFSAPARHLARGAVLPPFSMSRQTADGAAPRTTTADNLNAYRALMPLAGNQWRSRETGGARVRATVDPAPPTAHCVHRKRIAAAAKTMAVASAQDVVRRPTGGASSVSYGAGQWAEIAP